MRPRIVGFVLAVFVTTAFASTPLQVIPTTTLASQTGNNTSTSNLFVTTANGDMGPGNVSKVDTHSLLYPGFSGKIYAHLMGWFCMNAGSTATGAGTLCGSHVQIGYNSNDPSVIRAQVTDMVSRGFDGVIHDWYGPGNTRDDLETKNLMIEAQQHPNFTFAIMIDKGAIQWFSCYPNCSATQALLNLTQYAAATYFNSPNYMRINGRPVLTNFDIDLHYTVDWNYVAANTPGNPIFVFQNGSGFTHTLSAGSYSWVIINSQYGLDYLSGFYNTGMQYPSELTVGATYKGFNDTLASWSGNRVMSQQCGQTWLQTFAKANSMYNTSNQLGALQLVTWDDYEEGTEIESGIDNCLTVSGGMLNTTLKWAINGDESTVDHYTVFISLDGQNLMPLGDFPVGTRQVDLASYTPAVGSAYTLYVKAVGKPSFRNQMSGAVTFSYTAGVHMTPSNGATVGTPVTVNSYAVSVKPISAMVVYVDYNEVYRTSSGYVSTSLPLTAGNHQLAINAWDSTGALMQAKATITVVALQPSAALSLSSTTAVAPATISASTSGSTDPNSGGLIASSTINWGDGTSSAGPSASHTYNSAGSYTITATVTDNYGMSATTTRSLTINAPSITISSPANGSTVASPVHVVAYAVSGLPISTMIVYLDGSEVYRTSSATVDTNLTVTTGGHQIVTNAWNSAGTLMQSKVNITVSGLDVPPTGYLDTARSTRTGTSSVAQTDTLSVTGWAADLEDGAPIKQVSIFIDGKLAGNATLGISRPDVASYFSRPGWTNSGWTFSMAASTLAVGTHWVAAQATDSTATATLSGASSITVSGTTSNTPPTGYLDQIQDTVTGSTSISQQHNLSVRGWAADLEDGAPVRQVAIIIDGVQVGTATLGLSRPDVATYFNRPAWTNSGWTFTMSASALAVGTHTVAARASDSTVTTLLGGSQQFTVGP